MQKKCQLKGLSRKPKETDRAVDKVTAVDSHALASEMNTFAATRSRAAFLTIIMRYFES